MKEMTKKDRYTAFFLGVFFLLLSVTLFYIGISKSYNFANFIMESRLKSYLIKFTFYLFLEVVFSSFSLSWAYSHL